MAGIGGLDAPSRRVAGEAQRGALATSRRATLLLPVARMLLLTVSVLHLVEAQRARVDARA